MKDDIRDAIYRRPLVEIEKFQFNDQVASVFDDMISRSVPGYSLTLDMLHVIGNELIQPQSNVYDLGCALGASSLAISEGLINHQATLVAIDNAPAMIAAAKKNLKPLAQQCQQSDHASIRLLCENIEASKIEHASLVVLNFTLQFIPVAEKQAVLRNIANGLLPGGVLFLSEKIQFENRHQQALMNQLHHGFKQAQGYSQLEIAQKRTALENVLTPDTLDQHRERLQQAGFDDVMVWFQCFNFISMLAFKNEKT